MIETRVRAPWRPIMNPTKLRISKLAAVGMLAGALVASGLVTPKSSAQTAASAPATKPIAAGADQLSAREDAAKALDQAVLDRLRQLDPAATGDDRQTFIRRLTLDLAGRP